MINYNNNDSNCAEWGPVLYTYYKKPARKASITMRAEADIMPMTEPRIRARLVLFVRDAVVTGEK